MIITHETIPETPHLIILQKRPLYTLYRPTPSETITFSLHLECPKLGGPTPEEEARTYLYNKHPYFGISYIECLLYDIQQESSTILAIKDDQELHTLRQTLQDNITSYKSMYQEWLCAGRKGVTHANALLLSELKSIEANKKRRPNPFLVEFLEEIIEEREEESNHPSSPEDELLSEDEV